MYVEQAQQLDVKNTHQMLILNLSEIPIKSPISSKTPSTTPNTHLPHPPSHPNPNPTTQTSYPHLAPGFTNVSLPLPCIPSPILAPGRPVAQLNNGAR